jgi:hypothetical protein
MGILSMFTSKKNLPTTNVARNAHGSAAPVLGSGRQTVSMDSYLASDENAWLTYLRQAVRTYRKPGLSMQQERDLWYAARAQSRAMGDRAS